MNQQKEVVLVSKPELALLPCLIAFHSVFKRLFCKIAKAE